MQRIQSLYLAIVVVLCLTTLFATLGDIYTPAHEFVRINAYKTANFKIGVSHWSHINYGIPAYLLLTIIISLITLPLYNKRKVQMRYCFYSIVNQVVGVALIVLSFKPYILNHSIVKYYLPAFLPLATLILTWLAYKGIKSDDDKIKAIDRIR